MRKLIIRHDDFDFRMEPRQYIELHEEFIKRGLVETAVIQFTTDGKVKTYDDGLIEYMKNAPNWDLQLHGWQHNNYHEMSFDDIVREISAALYFFKELFGKAPTVWYPPWNGRSADMEKAAKMLNLEINNESYDMAQYIREMEAGNFNGGSVYFHLWEGDKSHLIPEMLKWAHIYEDRRH